jgi:regulation of enolase protein 1 (concanavalin A-like superfamily)
MNFEKAMLVAKAILTRKASDRVEISSDGEVWHVGCYGFANRKQNEMIIEVSKNFNTKYELARDGFDLW